METGGAGEDRTRAWGICSPLPYCLATAPDGAVVLHTLQQRNKAPVSVFPYFELAALSDGSTKVSDFMIVRISVSSELATDRGVRAVSV